MQGHTTGVTEFKRTEVTSVIGLSVQSSQNSKRIFMTLSSIKLHVLRDTMAAAGPHESNVC